MWRSRSLWHIREVLLAQVLGLRENLRIKRDEMAYRGRGRRLGLSV